MVSIYLQIFNLDMTAAHGSVSLLTGSHITSFLPPAAYRVFHPPSLVGSRSIKSLLPSEGRPRTMCVINGVQGRDSAPAATPAASAQMVSLLEALNESTKWAVSFTVFSVLLWRRDLLSSWCMLGSIAAAILCRVLKFAINEARPPAARKADPGMPSAHANSLAFLSTFVSVSAVATMPVGAALRWPLAVGVPACALFLAWLRVALGYHTLPQVAAGWVLGSTSAAAWSNLGQAVALPYLAVHPECCWWLYGATTAAVAVFIGQNVARWLDEVREKKAMATKKV